MPANKQRNKQTSSHLQVVHHQRVLPKGRSFTANFRHEGYSSPQRQVFHCKLRNQGCNFTRDNRCGNVSLLSAPHSLFSIWTYLKRSEKILGAPAWRWGEWIWLTGPSGLHLNSPQGFNISSSRVFDQVKDPDIPITLRPPPTSSCKYKNTRTYDKLFAIIIFCPSYCSKQNEQLYNYNRLVLLRQMRVVKFLKIIFHHSSSPWRGR